jgi:hypothetical protein
MEELGITMEPKNVASLILAVLGGVAALVGLILGETKWINLGLAGLFLAVVVYTFKGRGYVKKDGLTAVLGSYRELLRKMVSDLDLEGNAVYIPPYENLPEGGTFIPLREDFSLSLGRLDEETVFLTNVGSEREMGLSIRPTGLELLRKFEEHLEGSLEGSGPAEVESVAGSVLRALDLAKGVYIEEGDGGFRVVVRPDFSCDPEGCEQVACPVCSSVLLALSKATGQLIESESFERKEYGVEIRAKKLGGVREWM